ncbi:MAG TPA: hypothetical protein VMR86_05725, partial [Myxococcota bacterium]|nr:hypothetical protein [Myxococcota bacterium]
IGNGIAFTNSDVSGEFRFGVDRSLLLSPDLSIGFLDPNVPELGFDSLSIHISIDGQPVADFSFTDPAAVRAALDDQLIQIDLPASSPSDIATLVFSFVLHTSPPGGGAPNFFSDFALIAHTTAPEPAAWALLALGALILGTRRIG